jgi:hypothetical protein
MIPALTMLAEAAPPPTDNVSLAVLLGVIGAIFSGLALLAGKVIGHKQGEVVGAKKEQARQQGNVTLDPPIPEVPVRRVYPGPSWDQHRDLVRRVEASERHIEEMRADMGKQYIAILNAGQERERSIKDKIDEVAVEWHRRLDEIFKPKRPGTR